MRYLTVSDLHEMWRDPTPFDPFNDVGPCPVCGVVPVEVEPFTPSPDLRQKVCKCSAHFLHTTQVRIAPHAFITTRSIK